MDFEKFQRIILNNKRNKELVDEKLKIFYGEANMESGDDLLDIMQIARTLIIKTGFLLAEIPLKDAEIGAICYSGNGSKYVLLNSSLPRVNVNFSLCHEIYHILYQNHCIKESAELYMADNYYEHEEEMAANCFAASLMMPEQGFTKMFNKFKLESEETKAEIHVIAKLMNYFKAPYMAVLIRCYELELFEDGESLKKLLNIDIDIINNEFNALWLNGELLEASRKDDFVKLLELVDKKGQYLVSRELMREMEFEKIKNNIKRIYEEIRG